MSRGTVSELIRSVCKGLRGGGECSRLIRHYSVFPGLIQAGLFSDGGAPRRESLEEALGGGYCHC